MHVLSISGTTVTANSAVSVEAAITHNHYLFKIDASTAYFGYSKNTGTVARGVIISVSGTTPSLPGSITSGAATIVAAEGNLSICALSTTAYCYAYAGTTGYLAVQIFTVSGSAVTANSAVTALSNSVAQTQIKVCAASSTCVVIASKVATTASVNLWAVTISGTVPTLKSAWVAAFATPTTGHTLVHVNMMNGSYGVCTVADTVENIVGSLFGYVQCGFHIDAIAGDFNVELPRKVTCVAANFNKIGQTVGNPSLLTTANGQWGLTGFTDNNSKATLNYMNAASG